MLLYWIGDNRAGSNTAGTFTYKKSGVRKSERPKKQKKSGRLNTDIRTPDLLTCIFMENITLPHDLKVFGVHVRTFPNGIGEAFDALISRMPPGDSRSYYGISEMGNEGGILYYAAAEEKYDGEAKTYNSDIYIVKQGEYFSVTVNNWRKKTDSIKDVF